MRTALVNAIIVEYDNYIVEVHRKGEWRSKAQIQSSKRYMKGMNIWYATNERYRWIEVVSCTNERKLFNEVYEGMFTLRGTNVENDHISA